MGKIGTYLHLLELLTKRRFTDHTKICLKNEIIVSYDRRISKSHL